MPVETHRYGANSRTRNDIHNKWAPKGLPAFARQNAMPILFEASVVLGGVAAVVLACIAFAWGV